MAVNTVSGASGVSSEQLNAASKAVTNELGKDAFLKLLIAELANQDPLNPMDDREFVAQMAQFSALEQMTNVAGTLENMAQWDQYSAVNYVGKTVFFEYTDDAGVPHAVYDTVTAVFYDPKEGPVLELANYKELLSLSEIDGVTELAPVADSGETKA